MRTITVAGGDLYRLALQYLGDSTQWNRIAQANTAVLGNKPDPIITGLVTLNIPDVDPSAGGGVYAPGQQ